MGKGAWGAILVVVVALGTTNAWSQSVSGSIDCGCGGVRIPADGVGDVGAACQAACGGPTSNSSTTTPPTSAKPGSTPAPALTPFQRAQLDMARNLGSVIGKGLWDLLTSKPNSNGRQRQDLETERLKQLKADEERRQREAERAKFLADKAQVTGAMKGQLEGELEIKDAPSAVPLPLKDNKSPDNTTAGLRVTALTATSCYRTDPTQSGCLQIRNNSTKLARLYVEGLPGVQCTAPPSSYCTVPIATGRHHLQLVPDDNQGHAQPIGADVDLTKAGLQLTLFGGTP